MPGTPRRRMGPKLDEPVGMRSVHQLIPRYRTMAHGEPDESGHDGNVVQEEDQIRA